jgi:hypothetical protein
MLIVVLQKAACTNNTNDIRSCGHCVIDPRAAISYCCACARHNKCSTDLTLHSSRRTASFVITTITILIPVTRYRIREFP